MQAGGEAPLPLVRGRIVRRSLTDPLKTLFRSRKPYWIADKIRNRKRLDGFAVKKDSGDGVHPGEVFRYVVWVCTLLGVICAAGDCRVPD